MSEDNKARELLQKIVDLSSIKNPSVVEQGELLSTLDSARTLLHPRHLVLPWNDAAIADIAYLAATKKCDELYRKRENARMQWLDSVKDHLGISRGHNLNITPYICDISPNGLCVVDHSQRCNSTTCLFCNKVL